MGKPTVTEIALAISSATGGTLGHVMEASRRVLALLERKAAEPDGKPDPAPVASETPTIEKVIDLMGALRAALEPKDRP